MADTEYSFIDPRCHDEIIRFACKSCALTPVTETIYEFDMTGKYVRIDTPHDNTLMQLLTKHIQSYIKVFGSSVLLAFLKTVHDPYYRIHDTKRYLSYPQELIKARTIPMYTVNKFLGYAHNILKRRYIYADVIDDWISIGVGKEWAFMDMRVLPWIMHLIRICQIPFSVGKTSGCISFVDRVYIDIDERDKIILLLILCICDLNVIFKEGDIEFDNSILLPTEIELSRFSLRTNILSFPNVLTPG